MVQLCGIFYQSIFLEAYYAKIFHVCKLYSIYVLANFSSCINVNIFFKFKFNRELTMLYTTKDLSSLFKIIQKRNGKIWGFDILNECQLTCFRAEDVIRFNPNNKLFTLLMKSEDIRLEMVEVCFKNVEDQAKFLGLTERTLFRMKSRTKTCCTT
jgi:hypothetical protein